ncbi:LysR family transcriptional regulator [Pseudomonas sp. HR96]|uniref:LysR family transcriptional regulator n=1 Tax=Pseudomonas sp. HR96 TaxID=1027966 RepID=UPI002A75540F|nr:LysR family transcriptional regulator [Pseudomonas sp. HR96]WPO97931.1 LysR family transcriptional regulator [Pseudomonas sp. HR96]
MIPSLASLSSRLRLRQLRLLIALDEHGSLHKAAEHVSISQPGATKALNEIESTLGVSLFERNHKGLQPNDLGRCVIRYARLIHTDLAHLREEMLGILQGEGGRLSIGSIMGGVPLLLRAVGRLREIQPQLSIEIIEDTSARLLPLVDQGRLDLAICRSSVSRRPDDYDCLSLHHEELVVMAHPQHPLAEAASLGLADLADCSWVVYPTNMPMRLTLEREFREAGLEFPRYPIETSSTFATLMLLEQDRQLVALMPAEVARYALAHGLLSRLALQLRSRSEPYSAVVRRGVGLTAPASLLIEELRRESLPF